MALDETLMQRTVFVNGREEGGINAIYDPALEGFAYQVFIHNRFPFVDIERQEFPSFAEARSYAAKRFGEGWEMLSWDQTVKRPCADGGTECGSGSCATCQSMKNDGSPPPPEGASGCGGCGHA